MDTRKRNPGGSMPALDEGWWEAVLAEEGSQNSLAPSPIGSTAHAGRSVKTGAAAFELGQGEGPI